MADKVSIRTRLIGAAGIALLIGMAPVAGALAQAAQPAKPAAEAAKTDPRHVWDLSPIFPSVEAWDAERTTLLKEIPELQSLKGTLGKDAATLRAALDRISAINRRAEKVLVYAYIDSTTNNRDSSKMERRSLSQQLFGELGSATAWLSPEVQDVGAEKIESFIKADKGLEKHAFDLRDILRNKPHTLTAEAEGVLAALSPTLGAFSDTYSLLANADIDWPEVKVDGKEETVNQAGYGRLRQNPDRAVRKEVFDKFWATFSQYRNSMGGTLGAVVQANVTQAKLRNYPTAVAASLAANDIPEEVYRTLVAEANKGLPALHRYFKLRQKMLGLPDIHYYDIYPPMVKLDKKFDLDQSAALSLAAVKPLGEEYQSLMKQATSARSMHVFPAEGKESGAYQWGVYGITPYVFLNHQNDYNSMSTYIHEWGHGMHTILADRNQTYENAQYPLFVAEIASITNEILLSDFMLEQAGSKEERLYYLGEALESMRGTFFRQTMFAEFELATHDAMERGEALSGDKMTEIYCGLLKKYHGAEQGVMQIDDTYCAEWAYIPHFYRPFYVYQYATSIAAAAYWAEQVETGGPDVREKYLDILRAGGSKYPYPLLKEAGLDMASPAPYQALIKRMNAIMDEMEKILADKT
ncbi:oligoendopeptidase F [Indioceanicola profundi]|uniref:oligoendopeptidase F n=1 Tax=Indioceanicola profundi TaxID=2220096 RepID=UPI000E6AC900|nr:oligoendopeptidase F [Indioceanicola profundi]